MKEPLHIISNCVIADESVIKNGEVLYSDKNVGLSSFLVQLYKFLHIDYPKFYKMDNLSKLGWLASEVLLKDENIVKHYNPEEIGLLLTNANSSLEADVKYFQTIEMASPALFVYTLPNILNGEICIRNNFKGENACFIFETFNAAFIKEYVDDLFANNKLKLCICGWADVIGETYKAALFLIGKDVAASSIDFTEENMDKIFEGLNAQL
ncbi:hypothetical protein [Parafilimonas terrae]|uniref:Beta-ketoacyl synthase, N-terminal domain n=1 Tax=Parafilimonas terrae TaxID=1465490 RepID=A0A1I5Z7M3_9BACT|nr:hypothetical protein [Parafilimonas terrae]SFQ52473.1 hypothetical protein SAMN05444277_11758 [Parafilimonas terrae]